MRKIGIPVLVISALLSLPAIAEDREHNDREHEEAEKDLDHEHWEKAHGSGVPDKQPERKPQGAIRQ